MVLLLASLLLAQAASTEVEAAPAREPACADEAHAAFDFWVGDWDVYPNGGDKLAAHSSIEKLAGGCTVREQWMPLGGSGGMSLNVVNPDTGRWEQNWIGSDGTPVHFEGGLVGDAMVLTGYWADYNGPGEDGLVRMTYSPQPGGAVRQHGEVSFDHGLTWQDGFDLIYRPAGD